VWHNAALIAEIIPGAYDPIGRKVMRPDLRRKGLRPTFPMGRYVSQPLSVKCEAIRDVRKFLSTCRGVSDKEQFGKDDYWQPPEHFEKTKKGDCDDFAIWTWRQFLSMGYDARFVVGCKRSHGHAWVSLRQDSRYYVVEPQYWIVGDTFPRLSTIQFHPEFSVAWDGEKISFYSHRDLAANLKFRQIPMLLLDWITGWSYFWLRVLLRLPRILWFRFFKGTQQETK
jgi:hypothetical protein